MAAEEADDAADGWITCQGFELKVERNKDGKFIFELTNIKGSDGETYAFVTADKTKRKEMVKLALTTVAQHFPDFNWEFQLANGKFAGFR